MAEKETPSWLDKPRNVKRLWRGFLVVLALTVLAELVIELHPVFAIESLFAFNAWFGFLACALMILVARALGLLLKRRDDYYAEPEADDGADRDA
ncbi:MAG: hypothetical protein ABI281_09950 [Caldimonas sp.]